MRRSTTIVVRLKPLLPFIIISGVAIVELASITELMITSDNSPYFEATAFITNYLVQNDNNKNVNVIVISNPFYIWIPQYVFQLYNNLYLGYYEGISASPSYKKVVLIVDQFLMSSLKHHKAPKQIQNNFDLYGQNKIAIFSRKITNTTGSIETAKVTIYHGCN
jgi:hypothetical protein